MVKKISQNEFAQVQAQEIALVDFSASWCGPCKMLAPVLEKVSEELSGSAAFYNVDVEESPALAQQFNVSSVPTLVILKNGKKVDSQVGFQPKKNLIEFVKGQM